MTSLYALILLTSNLVFGLVYWDGDTSTWTPPDGFYAVAVPSGVVVRIGDSYNTTTQTFTSNNVSPPTPTPVPIATIGDCPGGFCFGEDDPGTGKGGTKLTLRPNPQPTSSINQLAGDAKVILAAAGNASYNQTGTISVPVTTGTLCVSDFMCNATQAGKLALNPNDCGANTYATTIDEYGNLTCSGVSLTAGVTGILPTANGGTGNTTGLAATSTALAANPTDCGANTYATTIDASGNLTCSSVSLTAGVTGTLPIVNGGTGNTTGLAATATALAADPADCAANRYATAINASGTLTCGQVSLSAGVTGTLPVSSGGTGAAPGADDQLFVSSSTSAGAWAAVPNCTDSGGNHLNYTAATNSFSCGTTSSASPTVGSDLTCDNSSVASTSAVTVLTLPTFSNTGKTTVISGAVAVNASAAGAARTYTVDVKLAGTSQITFTGKTESATSKVSIPFHWVDSTCGSSCAYTVTVTSDATTGTQTVTDCAASRVSY